LLRNPATAYSFSWWFSGASAPVVPTFTAVGRGVNSAVPPSRRLPVAWLAYPG
jgi:hypothetical protein